MSTPRVLAFSTISCLLLSALSAAAGTLSQEQQRRVAALEGKLLAPCCYQEPVARHQSEVALHMRMEIATMVEEGRSDADIIGGYVKRYGDKVIADYAPTPRWAQYVPWLLSAIGAALLGFWIRRMVQRHAAAESQAG